MGVGVGECCLLVCAIVLSVSVGRFAFRSLYLSSVCLSNVSAYLPYVCLLVVCLPVHLPLAVLCKRFLTKSVGDMVHAISGTSSTDYWTMEEFVNEEHERDAHYHILLKSGRRELGDELSLRSNTGLRCSMSLLPLYGLLLPGQGGVLPGTCAPEAGSTGPDVGVKRHVQVRSRNCCGSVPHRVAQLPYVPC